MCCCGETLWDTNPDTCANNCVFYRNHRGEIVIYSEVRCMSLTAGYILAPFQMSMNGLNYNIK